MDRSLADSLWGGKESDRTATNTFTFSLKDLFFLWLRRALIVAGGIFRLRCGVRSPLAGACELLAAACGMWFPDQGSNPDPLHWEGRVLATAPPGKSLEGSRGGGWAWMNWGKQCPHKGPYQGRRATGEPERSCGDGSRGWSDATAGSGAGGRGRHRGGQGALEAQTR